jgi:hypothetical protein
MRLFYAIIGLIFGGGSLIIGLVNRHNPEVDAPFVIFTGLMILAMIPLGKIMLNYLDGPKIRRPRRYRRRF